MAKASDNLFPYVHLTPAAAPASPAAGSQLLYLDSGNSNKLSRKDSSGTVVVVESSGSVTFVGAKARMTAAYNLVNNALTAVPWDTEDYDTNSIHDNVTNPSRFTIPTGQGGKYAVKANLGISVSGFTYSRFILLLTKNGTAIPGGRFESDYGTASFPMGGVTTDVDCAAADYLELQYLQISGASRAMDVTDCAMSIYKIG